MKEYLSLVIVLTLFSSLFLYFRHDPTMQTYIAAGGCILYSMWGAAVHQLRERLSVLVVLEYILVSSIAFWVLYVVIWL